MMKQFVLGVAIVASVSGCSKQTGPGAVVQDFFGRLQSGSCTGIKELILTSQRDLLGAAIEEGCTAASKNGSLKGAAPSIGATTETGDDATVAISDSTTSKTIKLKKENGVWKIDVTSIAM